jgi:hypothetical protein
MDASQITKLLQKQNTRYINRCQTVDASTLIWKNQIQSSKYIKGVKTCDGQQNCSVPTNPACPVGNGVCSFGGAGRTTALQTGSPQQFLNVLSGAAGSASQVYSSESITLQRAGKESCGVPGTNPAPENSYVVLPACFCTNTNGPTATDCVTDSPLNNACVPGNSTLTGNPNNLPINNQSNPYLPPFDTYYRFKNPIAQCSAPSRTGATGPPPTCQDQNLKHFVKECHSRFPNANNGVNAVCNPCDNTTYLDPITKQFHTDPNFRPPTCEGCVLEPEQPTPSSEPTPPPPTPFISYDLSCVNGSGIPIFPENTTFSNQTPADPLAGGVYIISVSGIAGDSIGINLDNGDLTTTTYTVGGDYLIEYQIGGVTISSFNVTFVPGTC